MKIFLSWSGSKSKETAIVLSNWLGQVIQAIEPWISVDIDKGTRWSQEIADKLEQSRVGIICLDRSNLKADWILFEAGAISKTKDAHVCTFLLDLKPSDIDQPLAQFQHTIFSKDDTKSLLKTINSIVAKVGEKALNDKSLDELFDIFWPKLEIQLKEILSKADSSGSKNVRSDRELLEEVLEQIRATQSQQQQLSQYIRTKDLRSKLWKHYSMINSVIDSEPDPCPQVALWPNTDGVEHFAIPALYDKSTVQKLHIDSEPQIDSDNEKVSDNEKEE